MNIWTRKDLKKLETKELVHPFESATKKVYDNNTLVRVHAMLELHTIVKELLSRKDLVDYIPADKIVPYVGARHLATARALLEELLKNENLLSHE